MPIDDPVSRIPGRPDEPVAASASAQAKKRSDPLRPRYDKLLSILRATSDVLKTAHCPRTVTDDYVRLLGYLASIDDTQIQRILSPSAAPKAGPAASISDDAIRKMSLEDVESLTRSEMTTRATLERVAVLRFFMTRGDISSARNRDALIERLLGMVENERTRFTIHKLASGEGRKTGEDQKTAEAQQHGT